MKFNRPVQLMGVTLQGEYLFVHDDEAMARGEACTYVYKGVSEVAKKRVGAFHCTPVERPKATAFTVRTLLTLQNQNEVMEFQFRDSTEGHLVPVPISLHVEHVNIAPMN